MPTALVLPGNSCSDLQWELPAVARQSSDFLAGDVLVKDVLLVPADLSA